LPDCSNSKKRRLLANTPRVLRSSGLSVCTVACGAKRVGTGEAGPDGPKSEENYFRIHFGFFEYTKALEICRRRLRRNFDMGIFCKFFWTPQGFYKNIICHAMK
jgi:hypothetical protein